MRLMANQAVDTTSPTLEVDGGLPIGLHRIRLIVVGASGRESRPAEVVIRVTGQAENHPIRSNR